jgi:hypothetical protein
MAGATYLRIRLWLHLLLVLFVGSLILPKSLGTLTAAPPTKFAPLADFSSVTTMMPEASLLRRGVATGSSAACLGLVKASRHLPAGTLARNWGTFNENQSTLAAKTGASSAANAARLRSQLTAEEIAGGHAFDKHVIQQGQFPGVTTRPQFVTQIENVINNASEVRPLSNGRTAYWDSSSGTVVIRNPGAVDFSERQPIAWLVPPIFGLAPEAASWSSRPCNAAGAPSHIFVQAFQRQGHRDG